MQDPAKFYHIILFFLLLGGEAVSQETDPLGAIQKKVLVKEVIAKLPQNNLPTSQTNIEGNTVYAFLLAHTNTSVRYTRPFPVNRYSDGTWPFVKDIIRNYSTAVGLPVDRVRLVGYFVSLNDAEKEFAMLNTLVLAYGIRGVLVPYDVDPVSKMEKPVVDIKQNEPKPTAGNLSHKGIRQINLPDFTVTKKGKITLGITPIIDSVSNLSQQFAIFQFLLDNPIVINGRDTLHATLTDTRTFTYFAVSGTSQDNGYRIKIWQKDKVLAEIVQDFSSKDAVTLKERLPVIATQIGKVIGQDHFELPRRLNYKNIYDSPNIIQDETKRSSFIVSLFPDTSNYYIPRSGFLQHSELSYLKDRISNKGFDIANYNAVKGAQLVSAIYSQKDDRLFFIRNGNVPEITKERVKKIVQPTSRRLGSALSYISTGLDSKASGEMDVAASCFYSALLLTNNLAGSVYEKAWIKRTIYRNMSEIYKKRNQFLLGGMFSLVADLNDSFLKSDFCKLAHVEYYQNLEKLAEVCSSVENSARTIQSNKNSAVLLGVLSVATAAGAKGGIGNLSGMDIAAINIQVENTLKTAQQSGEALKEIAADVNFSSVEIREQDGVMIELNQLYLAREIVSHLLLRADHETAAKQISKYAADKPNLLYFLEEVYAEGDKKLRNRAFDDLLDHTRMIETQGILYESRGRQVPVSKTKLF